MHALEQKPKALEDSENKIDFESGVYMGMGSFNVVSEYKVSNLVSLFIFLF